MFLVKRKSLLEPPSTIYVAKVHGLPEKPIKGTCPPKAERMVDTAFMT